MIIQADTNISPQFSNALQGIKNRVLGDTWKIADNLFIYRAFPLQNPTSSLFQAYETVVSSVWNSCFKRMKQLFQAYETVALAYDATVSSYEKVE